MKKILSRISIGSAAAITLAAGLTGVVGATTLYDGHGKDDHKSKQTMSWDSTLESTTLGNFATFRLHNDTEQTAATGDVEVKAEDEESKVTVGNVITGDAMNANATSATVAIDNRNSNSAALTASGGQSTTQIVKKDAMVMSSSAVMKMATNETELSICNDTDQGAYSGDVEVKAEDEESKVTVGDVTTGDATNTNSTSFVFTVAN